MDIIQEHRSLIENIIKSNSRFKGNEDLLEDFCSEAFQRTYNVLSSVDNVEKIEPYIKKVSTTAIIEVLRTAGRLKRTLGKYEKTNETMLSDMKPTKRPSVNDLDPFYDIPDPKPHFEEKLITKAEVEKIREIVEDLENREIGKNFRELFILRYLKEYKQSRIAKELSISQGEVSKRLLKITKEVNKRLHS